MRILIINNFRNNHLGGVENYLQELMQYPQNGNPGTVFRWFGSGTRTTKWHQKFYNRRITKEIIAEIDSFEPDIIHCFSIGSTVTPHFMGHAKHKSIPIIFSFRDYYYICPKTNMISDKGVIGQHGGFWDCVLHHHPKKNLLYDALLYWKQWYHKQLIKKNIDYFITPSEKLTNCIRTEFPVPGKTLPNPVLLTHSNLESNSDYLLFVGRLETGKGVQTLLKAFKNIVAKYPDEHLKIVGSGSFETSLENFKAENKIKNVTFLGAKNRSELAGLYAAAKFTIVPSEIQESYGNVILESFAFKKTVIVSNLLGLADDVVSSESGLVFPFGDVQKLQTAIEKLITNDGLRETLAQNASQFVASRSFDSHFTELMAIYSSILRR